MITAYNHELKAINAAIEKSIKGLDLNSYTALQTIPGIGPVFAAGILSELGNIHSFKDNGAVANTQDLYGENTSPVILELKTQPCRKREIRI